MKEKIIFIIFFIITFLISIFSRYKDGGDDLFFKTATTNYSLWNFIIFRYLNWSGRIIPDILAYLFNGTLQFLWPLFNSAIITLLSVLIFNYTKLLTAIKTNKNSLLAIVICLSFFLIDKTVIGPSFLWRTGSINYLWPVTFGLLAFYPFLLSTKNKLIKYKTFYFFASLFAALSMEQMSLALILAIITYVIYMFINKKPIPLIIYLMIFNIAIGSVVLFLAPGNQVRIQTETKHNFPEFLSLSLFNRLSISLYWFFNKLINICSLSLAFIYLTLGIKSLSNKKIKIVSIIAIILGLLLIIKNIFGIDYKIMPITSNNYLSFNILIKYFVSIICLSLIPYLIWQLFKNIKNSFVYFLILLIILVTILIITLSPTMDVSGNRVLFLPIILLNILGVLFLFQKRSQS